MSSILLFTLLGLGVGAVTALLAVGVVVEYKASSVVNFAHGAMAMFSAYCFTELRSTGDLVLPVVIVPHRVPLSSHGLATTPAVIVTLVYSAVFGVLVYLGIFRWLRGAPALAKVVASIGLMLTLQALAILHFGTAARPSPRVLPNATVTILGATVGRDRLLLAAIALASAIVLAAIYRLTRFGIVTRACAQNERAATLLGWWPVRAEIANWAIAGALAGLAGILAAPITSLTPSALTLAIVPALAAALVADLSSFTVAAAAGLLIGVGQSLCVKAAATWTWFPQRGMAEVLPFAVIAVVMLVRGNRLPTRGETNEGRLPRAPLGRRPLLPLAVFVPVCAALVVATSGGWRAAVIQSVVTACVLLSLVVLTGLVGQVSLAQAAFAGIGGFLLAKLLDAVGVPFPIGLLFAGLITVPIGLAVGLPALRIRGINLAIITLGAGVAIDAFVFRNEQISGGLAGVSVPAPQLFGIDVGISGSNPGDYPRIVFGLVAIATFTALALLAVNLRRSATGAHCLAVRTNERAASAIGINVAATKLLAFGLSAFIAGSAGGLIGYQQGRLSPESFSIFVSLMLLSIAYIGGIATVPGVIFAAFALAPGGLVYTAMERWFHLGEYQPIVAGVGVIISAILNPDGVTAAASRARAGARRRSRAPAEVTRPATPVLAGGPT
ncbi:MAG TPA: ABC transporter permease [Acidimicrobiales bacterium]|nr:ABC transporter permease [Acidimicrobiales bacterium]